MSYKPEDPAYFLNDRLVLSKGHAAPILYAAWAHAGFVDRNKLKTLRQVNSDIEGHPIPMPSMPFIDVATGSLGQGLGVACGMAYSSKYMDKLNNKYYCIVGDGESAEGSIWEAANFAVTYFLDNLIVFLDCNKFGQSTELNKIDLLHKQFQAFGWQTYKINGHSVSEIIVTLDKAKNVLKKPTIILCDTIKGYNFGEGIENSMKYHGKPIGPDTEKTINHIKTFIKNPEAKLKPKAPEGENYSVKPFTL